MIEKASECACPSERAQSVASVAGTSNRVQKTRNRKSTNTINSSTLEKAIKASQDAETDSSSLLTGTPTNPSFPSSDRSISNGASPSSSASSTPRILPSPSRKQSYGGDIKLPDLSTTTPVISSSPKVSSCCKPKLPRRESEPVLEQKAGGCCSSKANGPPKPLPVQKSCCSGKSQPNQADTFAQINGQTTMAQNFPQFPQFQQGQFQNQPYGAMNQGFDYNMSSNMGMPLPLGFNTPIYNHMASRYQQPPSMPMSPTHNGAVHAGMHGAEHNCHCGDGCSCFGCAAHPNNATMTEYIRLMAQFQSTGGFGPYSAPTYDMPAYPHHPGFGAEAEHGMAFNTQSTNFPPFSAGQMSFPMNMNSTMSIPNTPVMAASPWPQLSTQAPLHTPSIADAQFFSAANANATPVAVKTEENAPSPATLAVSPTESKDEDTPTLSPSSYFWSELELPGCNDATGTCQCGDGCECVGCLTHGGHNGVAMENPSAVGHDTFSDFFMGNTLGGNGNPMASAFPEAPT